MKRLIKALSVGSARFFVHVDKKCNDKEIFNVEDQYKVTFVRERIPVYWGDYSQVEATINLMKTALLCDIQFERFVLLSGSDYPVRSAGYIERFFRNSNDMEFMNIVEMPADEYGKPISRMTTYRLRPGDGKLINGAKYILMKSGVLPRKRDYKKYIGSLIPYGGSTWWALTRNAVEYVLKYIAEQPNVVNFFKNTICPDEMFFQTILGNSGFKSRMTGNLTYTDWSGGGPSPAYISDKHIELLTANLPFMADDAFGKREILFARKFADDSELLVSILDRKIKEVERTITSCSDH